MVYEPKIFYFEFSHKNVANKKIDSPPFLSLLEKSVGVVLLKTKQNKTKQNKTRRRRREEEGIVPHHIPIIIIIITKMTT